MRRSRLGAWSPRGCEIRESQWDSPGLRSFASSSNDLEARGASGQAHRRFTALEGEAPRFNPLHAPEESGVAWVAAEVSERTAALMESLGQSGADREEGRRSRDDPWLAGLYAAGVSGRVATGFRVGRRVQTAGVARNSEDEPAPGGPRCANVGGFSVHANVAIRWPGDGRSSLSLRQVRQVDPHTGQRNTEWILTTTREEIALDSWLHR